MPNQVAIDAAKQWINSTEARKKAFGGMLSDAAALEELGTGTLMHSDYTKKTQEAAAIRKEAEELLAKNKEKKEELEAWRQNAQGRYSDTVKENARLKAYQAEAGGLIQSLAAKYGIPEEEIKLQMEQTGQGATAAAAAVEKQGGVAAASADYIPREDFNRSMDDLVGLQVELQELSEDHRELFGSRLDTRTIVKEAAASNRTVREVWEERHKVTDKRQELAEQKRQAEEERIRKDERQKVAAEFGGAAPGASPVARPEGANSAALRMFRKQQSERAAAAGAGSGSDGARQQSVVDAAVADFANRRAETA